MKKESFKVNAATELKERTAALNTQLRFGRERPALMHAYELRAFLQLRGAKTDDEKQQLERVEKVIAGLEKRKTSGIQRLLKTIIETAIRSLTPEDDSEQTLLDQFNSLSRGAYHDEEDQFVEPQKETESELAESTPAGADLADDEDGWGWGGETVSSMMVNQPYQPVLEEPEEDHWGGGGYS